MAPTVIHEMRIMSRHPEQAHVRDTSSLAEPMVAPDRQTSESVIRFSQGPSMHTASRELVEDSICAERQALRDQHCSMGSGYQAAGRWCAGARACAAKA